MEIEEIIKKLKVAFEKTEVKEQVLDAYWLQLNLNSGIHTTGFCFSASEIIYRLTGGKEKWLIKSINDPKDWNNGTHYFLQDKETEEVLDITSSQYTERGIVIPYEKGKARGLQRVSIKAKKLIELTDLGEL
ncbi:MAG: hypothetical protein ACJAYP_001394 [Flavobacterium sp.]|jgi:hypothetical protein